MNKRKQTKQKEFKLGLFDLDPCSPHFILPLVLPGLELPGSVLPASFPFSVRFLHTNEGNNKNNNERSPVVL